MIDAIISFLSKNSDTIVLYTMKIPAVLIALIIHELAHSFMANILGDPTAKESGRLSLNPFKHIDPVGAVCLYLFQIGWAKPVPINSKFFKNERTGVILTSLAGPLANLITFVVSCGLMVFTYGCMYVGAYWWGTNVFITILGYFYILFQLIAGYNFVLGLFNLLPLFPLDASRALMCVLPRRISKPIMRYEAFISIGVVALLIIDRFTLEFIQTSISIIYEWAGSIILPIFEFFATKIIALIL